jgi:hypothetical protein
MHDTLIGKAQAKTDESGWCSGADGLGWQIAGDHGLGCWALASGPTKAKRNGQNTNENFYKHERNLPEHQEEFARLLLLEL